MKGLLLLIFSLSLPVTEIGNLLVIYYLKLCNK